MSTVTEPGRTIGTDMSDGLRPYMTLPDWLVAIIDPDRVRSELTRSIPEFASGALILQGCDIKRARLKKSTWTAMYRLTVAEPGGGEPQAVVLRGTLIPPTTREPQTTDGDQKPFGSAEWRLYSPELRLELAPQPPDAALPALPILTDAE